MRFLMLSNFGYMGKPDTLHLVPENTKPLTIKQVYTSYEYIKDCYFGNQDFEHFIRGIPPRNNKNAFIYADPPYLQTGNNYSQGFTEADSLRLFDALRRQCSRSVALTL